MIRVLIIGEGSYIGTRLSEWLSREPGRFETRALDVKGGVDVRAFSGMDAVVHVAGIAHRKAAPDDGPLYHRVNCELALECAREAQRAGVRQFVFFSSMSVYGMVTGRIDAQTRPAPNTCYGQSKWDAEQGLAALAGEDFHVAVLRPPMVYGPGCRGNYPRLSRMVRRLPVFPKVNSQRSMIYIGTLCRFLQQLIVSGAGGLYFPQNAEYVNITQLAREVSRCHGKRLLCVPGFGWLLEGLGRRVPLFGKVFGTLVYDQALSTAFADDGALSFAETIRLTEVGE